MTEAKVLQFRRRETQDPPAPGRSYHCSFTSDRPEDILRLAQLAADLGIRMFVLENPKV